MTTENFSRGPQLQGGPWGSMGLIRVFMRKNIFLDASSHLYNRVCPSIGPSVGPSVHNIKKTMVRDGMELVY